jgi:hypothetical protein
MVRGIQKRIEESFDKDDREQVLKYMDWIYSSILDYVQTVRRNAAVLLLLIAAFELVVESRNTTLSIGSFSISKNSVALVFVPAIVGFLLMQILLDTQKAGRLYDGVFTPLFRIWSPKAAGNKLDLIIDQPQPACGSFKYPLPGQLIVAERERWRVSGRGLHVGHRFKSGVDTQSVSRCMDPPVEDKVLIWPQGGEDGGRRGYARSGQTTAQHAPALGIRNTKTPEAVKARHECFV